LQAFFTKLQLLSIVAESVTWKRENKNGNKFAATNNIECTQMLGLILVFQ
jgi:hypothetical protein